MTSSTAYQQYRPLMFSIAYRMLGSVTEAEDVLQEAFLRYHRAESAGTGIESPKAFLSAVTTRLCIDELRSARARREAYPGEWLPEPLLTAEAAVLAGPPPDDPAAAAEQADTLSMAFLLLLERLSPVERAVFLLHDVFSYGYDEVASIVGKSEDNCRQLALRARRHVADGKPRFEASRGKRDELAATFFRAVQDGDLDGLVGMLAADVVVVGDNAGVQPRWPRPIIGRDRVSRLLVGLGQQIQQAGHPDPPGRGERAAGRAVRGLRRTYRQRVRAGHRGRPGPGHPLHHQPGQAAPPRPAGRPGSAPRPAPGKPPVSAGFLPDGGNI